MSASGSRQTMKKDRTCLLEARFPLEGSVSYAFPIKR